MTTAPALTADADDHEPAVGDEVRVSPTTYEVPGPRADTSLEYMIATKHAAEARERRRYNHASPTRGPEVTFPTAARGIVDSATVAELAAAGVQLVTSAEMADAVRAVGGSLDGMTLAEVIRQRIDCRDEALSEWRARAEGAEAEMARMRQVWREALETIGADREGLTVAVARVRRERDEAYEQAARVETRVRALLATTTRERDEAREQADALQRDFDAEMSGRLALRARVGARDDEGFPDFVERLARERDEARAEIERLRAELRAQVDAANSRANDIAERLAQDVAAARAEAERLRVAVERYRTTVDDCEQHEHEDDDERIESITAVYAEACRYLGERNEARADAGILRAQVETLTRERDEAVRMQGVMADAARGDFAEIASALGVTCWAHTGELMAHAARAVRERDESRAAFLACAQAAGVVYEAEGHNPAPGPVADIVAAIERAVSSERDGAEARGDLDRLRDSLDRHRREGETDDDVLTRLVRDEAISRAERYEARRLRDEYEAERDEAIAHDAYLRDTLNAVSAALGPHYTGDLVADIRRVVQLADSWRLSADAHRARVIAGVLCVVARTWDAKRAAYSEETRRAIEAWNAAGRPGAEVEASERAEVSDGDE